MDEQTIAYRVKKMREEREVGEMGQLAYRSGVPYHTVRRIELGGSRPFAEDIAKLAEVLRVSTDYLLGLTDDPAPARERDNEDPGVTQLAALADSQEDVQQIIHLLCLVGPDVWGYVRRYLEFEVRELEESSKSEESPNSESHSASSRAR